MNVEFDSSMDAWKYFQKVYKEENWSLIKEFDMASPMTYGEKHKKSKESQPELSRYLCWIKEDSEKIKDFGKYFSFGGDCDFNFNDKKKSKFKKIANESEELTKQLQFCCSKHYSYENLSIMPATGGLNILKGRLYLDCNSNTICLAKEEFFEPTAYDRLDTFVCCLNNFYTNDDKLVLQADKYGVNKKCLENFLLTFADIYDYCHKIYFIDRGLVDLLIENGTKPIETPEALGKYMELANLFWEQKKEYCKSFFD